MSKNRETIELPKAFFRTEEGMTCLETYETWLADNNGAVEADERLARLEKLTAKPSNTGIGEFVIKAVGAAGEDGIAKTALLPAVIKISKGRKFSSDGLRGYLSMQGIKTDKKPDAPIEDRDGVYFLSDKGQEKNNGFAEGEEEEQTAALAEPVKGGNAKAKKVTA